MKVEERKRKEGREEGRKEGNRKESDKTYKTREISKRKKYGDKDYRKNK